MSTAQAERSTGSWHTPDDGWSVVVGRPETAADVEKLYFAAPARKYADAFWARRGRYLRPASGRAWPFSSPSWSGSGCTHVNRAYRYGYT